VQAIILAGGFGTRISEETHGRPKPMIEIGSKPILWHIMKTYSHYGINDFVVCCGYMGYYIKEYFSNYYMHMSDVTFDMCNNSVQIHRNECEPWRVTLVDTGLETMTGGRLKRVAPYIKGDTFCFTYGDGVSDVNIADLLAYHAAHGKLATLTAVLPPGRFGALNIGDDQQVRNFQEKPEGDGSWVNGGFFVLSSKVLDYVAGDDCIWEREPLERLAAEGQLAAYRHQGFWFAMDTLRDKMKLEALWAEGKAPWKVW
jgi:glucose-1-phosphate cytidylyltransferase